MIKLSANLSMLFTEDTFLRRFKRAADNGFAAVEFLFPYEYKAQEILEKLEQFHLKIALHNLPAGNWEAGERGIACHPDRVEEFKKGVDLAIAYASALGVNQLNCLSGIKLANVSDAQAENTLIENLRYAAEKLKAVNIKLLVEPINNYDIPGFILKSTKKAIEILDAVGSDNIYLQYDIYHAQRMEGELLGNITKYFERIAHLQIADNPGRNEPGTGEINYKNIFKALNKLNYQGWVGCEYKPAKETVMGLVWVDTHGLHHQ